MKTAIDILRKQLVLCIRIKEIYELIREKLIHSTSGQGISPLVKQLEVAMNKLSQTIVEENEFLQNSGFDSMTSFLQSLPKSDDQLMLQKLKEKIDIFLVYLKKENASNQTLLKRSKSFIDFNINVMNQTVADDIYAPAGQNLVENHRNLKMFDESV